MAELEKVIKGVHDARRYLEDREWVDKSVGVHIDALNDALALLKEQEAKIEQLNRFVNGFSRDAMPVVRCKDCYWRSEVDEECANSDGVCYRNGRVQDDFFCADGERRTD